MKIIELLIDELEELGFDQVALVSEPAIEAGFFAFKENNVEDAIAFQLILNAMEEKLVSRLPGEDKESYIGRCIQVTKSEGYEEDQAAAICYAGLKKKFNSIVIDGRNAYDNIEDALAEAKEIGCDGHHEHEQDGQIWYMACLEMYDMDADVGALPNYNNETSGSIVPKEVFDHHYDDLPEGTQEKLLERLSEIGISRSSLTSKGFEFEEEKEEFTNRAATAAIPVNVTSAKPDAWTNEQVGDFKILFQYKGPVDEKNRPFCRKLMDLDLLFRKEDIERLTVSGANSKQFGYYNIFNYKGSFNCRHRWTKVRVYDKKGIGSLEVAGIIAAEKIFNPNITFSSQKDTVHKFSVDGDLMRVTGAMMIPDKLIFRVDEDENPYYVYFSEATVGKIANKMMKEKLLDRVNLEHDPESPVNAHLIESWITKQETIDKLGQKLPKGTWMSTYQIEDDHIWELIKNGTFTGYSIEGFFSDRLVQKK
tara:strand:+ start:477 stop:1913 length:1437 start_codon:yes stop_codon:yes gene_type:complete